MHSDGETKFFTVVLILWSALILYLRSHEIGKTEFNNNSDDKKYDKWVDAHFAGAGLFIVAYGILRFAGQLLFDI